MTSPSTSASSAAAAIDVNEISIGVPSVWPEMMSIVVSVGASMTGETETTACTGVADSSEPSSRATTFNADCVPLALREGVQ